MAVERAALAIGIHRDDRVAGVRDHPERGVGARSRHEIVPVGNEAEGTQRLVDRDRLQHRGVVARDARAAALVGADAQGAVPGGGAFDLVRERLRQSRERELEQELPQGLGGLARREGIGERLGGEAVAGCLGARLAPRHRAQSEVQVRRERPGCDRGEVVLQVDAVDLGGQEGAEGGLVGRTAVRRAARPHGLLAGIVDDRPALQEARELLGACGPRGIVRVCVRPRGQGEQAALRGSQGPRQVGDQTCRDGGPACGGAPAEPLHARGRDEERAPLGNEQARALPDRDELVGGCGILHRAGLDEAAAIGGAQGACPDAAEGCDERRVQHVGE